MSSMCKVVYDDKDTDLDLNWEIIRKPVWNILNGWEAKRDEKIASILAIAKLCMNNEVFLYNKISNLFEEFCRECCKTVSNAENVVEAYCLNASLYQQKADAIDKIFRYPNKTFIKKCGERKGWETRPIDIEYESEPEFTKISNRMNEVWSEVFFTQYKILASSIIDLMRKDKYDSKTVEKEIQLFMEEASRLESHKREINHSIYKNGLEKPLLELLGQYYRDQFSKHLATNASCEEYIKMCIEMIEYERNVSEKHLPNSKELIVEEVWKSLVFEQKDYLLENSKDYLKNYNITNLKMVYQLVKCSSEINEILVRIFEDYENCIYFDIRKNNEDSKFCERFVEAHMKEKRVLEEAFESNTLFVDAMNRAISNCMKMEVNGQNANIDDKNLSGNSLQIPNLLISYCDQFMTKGTKGVDETELDFKLDGVMTIFRYVEDKDIFIKLYAKSLARRLINSMSQSMEAEESIIAKLTNFCGNEYARNIKCMITDVKLSEDVKVDFIKENVSSIPHSFNIMILQSGSWPIRPCTASLYVPNELEKVMHLFNDYYKGKNSGKKLNWHHEHGSCELKMSHTKKPYTIQATTYITSILVVFNDNVQPTLSEVATITGIPSEDLLKYMQYLVGQKILLCKESNNISDESKFTLNLKYENKRSKFKLMPVLKNTSQDSDKTIKYVVEERKMYLQALIVRIMKANNEITHKELVIEIFKESRSSFVPSQVFLDENINILVQKEYMEKFGGDENVVYAYIA